MGLHHRPHAARFFELTNQPVSIVVAMTSEECERSFTRLRSERMELFYGKAAIEFDTV